MPPNLKKLLSGAPPTASSPLGFHITTGLILKSGLSLMLSVVGFYFLAYGKKNQEPEKMLWGAALIVASFLIF